MTPVDVVAGIIFSLDRGSVLLALRKPHQHQGDRWEFPGGKVDLDEDQDAALSRELFEELGLSVTQSRYRRTLEHQYPDKLVRLHFWDVLQYDGEAQGMEGQSLQWVLLSELPTYTFPEANQPIVDELQPG